MPGPRLEHEVTDEVTVEHKRAENISGTASGKVENWEGVVREGRVLAITIVPTHLHHLDT